MYMIIMPLAPQVLLTISYWQKHIYKNKIKLTFFAHVLAYSRSRKTDLQPML